MSWKLKEFGALPTPNWKPPFRPPPPPLLAGVSLARPRPIDLAPLVRVPTLVLHGTADPVVCVSEARRLAAAFPSPAPILEVAGAGHADVVHVGGEEVLDRVATFLDAARPLPDSA